MAGPPDSGEKSQNLAPVPTSAPVHVPDATVMSESVVELRRSTRVQRFI